MMRIFNDIELVGKSIYFRKLFITKGIKNLFYSSLKLKVPTKIWNYLLPGSRNLDFRGLVFVGTWVEPGQIIALRIRPIEPCILTPHECLLFDIFEQKPATLRNNSFYVPEKIRGRVLNIEVFPSYKKRDFIVSHHRRRWNVLLDFSFLF